MIRDGNEYETRCVCNYCGTEIKLKWTEGALPSCPNCGAVLREVVENSVIEDKLQDIVRYDIGKRRSSHGTGILAVIIIMIVSVASIISFRTVCQISDRLEHVSTTVERQDPQRADPDRSADSIYVKEIGRKCPWYDEYESYYDQVSDCYFWFKEEDLCWEYWFEGISSDYGDYGWMQYDYFDNTWYIEESHGNWIPLPEKYDASVLWHMDETGTGRYKGLDILYIDAIGRECEFDASLSEYYDPETKCHFWYNDLVEPPIWQYWYEGISSDHGDYGWMEYDEDEGRWYIETDESGWVVLPDKYDTSGLWHIDAQYE
ncbi:MAG: hypothetical protein IKR73_01935 [Oscillospiraceae bacterium]|nr:hypothetical protein [Oscillospiraceae bacterium]